jgi:hypothetical protein
MFLPICSTLTEEYGLRVFEKKVLRKIFGHTRQKVAGERKKLHTQELHDLHCDQILSGRSI